MFKVIYHILQKKKTNENKLKKSFKKGEYEKDMNMFNVTTTTLYL